MNGFSTNFNLNSIPQNTGIQNQNTGIQNQYGVPSFQNSNMNPNQFVIPSFQNVNPNQFTPSTISSTQNQFVIPSTVNPNPNFSQFMVPQTSQALQASQAQTQTFNAMQGSNLPPMQQLNQVQGIHQVQGIQGTIPKEFMKTTPAPQPQLQQQQSQQSQQYKEEAQQLLATNIFNGPATQLSLKLPSMITAEELKADVVKPLPEAAPEIAPSSSGSNSKMGLGETRVRRVKPITTTLDSKDIINYYPLSLQMFPVRCYTCGFVYDTKDPTKTNVTLEEAAEIDIRAGVSLVDFMKKNRIVRMCCRIRVLEAPFITQLQKEAHRNKPSEIEKAMSELNLNNTSSENIIANYLPPSLQLPSELPLQLPSELPVSNLLLPPPNSMNTSNNLETSNQTFIPLGSASNTRILESSQVTNEMQEDKVNLFAEIEDELLLPGINPDLSTRINYNDDDDN